MLQKIILRDQIGSWLQEQLLSGSLQNGEKLSLVDISKDLEVSVTPIREALSQLSRAGIVETIPNRGFFVPALSAKEAQDIYPAIYALEKLALEQSKLDSELLIRLKQIQTKFENAISNEEAARFDLEFHEILISNYENRVTANILRDLKIRVFFYELEYMNSKNHKKSSETHLKIIQALEVGNKSKAYRLLQQNWETSAEFIEKHYAKNSSIL
ncbi:GntR family transcriptional regulator [Flagellimonas algicola]|uniref:GntR family transcriptional regulator n=1 Tax=Flagellimonas algicola TaxID=2583815 RepID=A0ABY2WNQ8_9FLAO|nr:GntR family transcriptional regulator [Allomuricauda algicola]TMU56624.1 GntR family transcriptional regulator [Allomuricauda algicola]